MGLKLKAIPSRLAVCRLDAGAEVPAWAGSATFSSVTRTDEEVSIVCDESKVPPGVRAESGWRAFRVEGPLDFSLIGILLAIAEPLSKAGISLFAISTFDTDYVLVKEESFQAACEAPQRRGHQIG